MSITAETAREHANDPAVLCCRAEEGLVIGPANLEDPAIFDELVDSGLLNLDGCLTIGQILGAKLTKTCDSLTPVTADVIDAIVETKEDAVVEDVKEEVKPEPVATQVQGVRLKIHIGECKDINIELPVGGFASQGGTQVVPVAENAPVASATKEVEQEAKVIRSLTRNHYKITEVKRGPETKIEGTVLYIREGIEEEAIASQNLVNSLKIDIITPDRSTQVQGGRLKIHIGEGKDINIEIPVGGFASQGGTQVVPVAENAPVASAAKEVEQEAKVVRSLTRNHYQITEVKRGPETKIEGTVLYIREGIEEEAIASQNLVNSLKIDIITPDRYNTYSETIMDVQPIATKDGEDELGLGTTRVIDGVVMMVTGTDANGVQIGEFGSSEGILEENIMWGRPGCPEKGEIFIKTEVIIKEGTNMERPGPLAAHAATDFITQEIREALKKLDDELIVDSETFEQVRKEGTNMERPGPLAAHAATDFITQEIREALKKLDDELIVDSETFEQVRRPGKKKVVIVKEIMGQGAMHDNLILPMEPVGVLGAKPNVDLGNVPVMVSPLEVLDGCIHATLT